MVVVLFPAARVSARMPFMSVQSVERFWPFGNEKYELFRY